MPRKVGFLVAIVIDWRFVIAWVLLPTLLLLNQPG